MRALVTGGAGFIGSHLCGRLIRDGYEVVCVDNLYSSTKANLDDLAHHPRFEFIRHDVTFPTYIETDVIFHLACPASPVFYQRRPVETTKTSVIGTINMLGLAKRTGARLLLTSTSEVYGDPEVHPQPEEYWGNVNPVGPRACYDEGKRCAETLVYDYRREHGMPVKVVRIFNTYGPRMLVDDGRVVSNFIRQALDGDPLTVYGDGKQTRSFCYVDDMVDGLVRMADTDDDTVGPVNLGNPTETTIGTLAATIADIAGVDLATVYRPLPVDDPRQRCPDITRAREWLGWQPTTLLRDGLTATIDTARLDHAMHRLRSYL